MNIENKDQNSPLVSIIVVAYNSEKYVLETLESVKAQTYQNIELIISDDGSKDETVEICRQWLNKNMNRFVRTELLEVESNTGISANCNRGLNNSKGEWVKFIAADDIFEDNFFVNTIELMNESSLNIIAGSIFKFENNVILANFFWPSFEFPQNIEEQKRRQIIYGFLYAPSIILRRKKLIELGGFDERFRYMEDDPLWFKFFENGITCKYSPKSIVYYRQHFDSINSQESRKIFYKKPIFLIDTINFGFWVILPWFKKNKKYFHFALYFFIKTLEKKIYKRGAGMDSSINIFFIKLIKISFEIYYRLPYSKVKN